MEKYVPAGSLTTVTKVTECGMQYVGPAYNLQLLILSCGHSIYFRGRATIGQNIPCVECLR